MEIAKGRALTAQNGALESRSARSRWSIIEFPNVGNSKFACDSSVLKAVPKAVRIYKRPQLEKKVPLWNVHTMQANSFFQKTNLRDFIKTLAAGGGGLAVGHYGDNFFDEVVDKRIAKWRNRHSPLFSEDLWRKDWEPRLSAAFARKNKEMLVREFSDFREDDRDLATVKDAVFKSAYYYLDSDQDQADIFFLFLESDTVFNRLPDAAKMFVQERHAFSLSLNGKFEKCGECYEIIRSLPHFTMLETGRIAEVTRHQLNHSVQKVRDWRAPKEAEVSEILSLSNEIAAVAGDTEKALRQNLGPTLALAIWSQRLQVEALLWSQQTPFYAREWLNESLRVLRELHQLNRFLGAARYATVVAQLLRAKKFAVAREVAQEQKRKFDSDAPFANRTEWGIAMLQRSIIEGAGFQQWQAALDYLTIAERCFSGKRFVKTTAHFRKCFEQGKILAWNDVEERSYYFIGL